MNKEIEIPEGYEAKIKGNKVVLEPKESDDERIRKELLKEIEFISPRDGETDGEGLILPSYHARIDRYKSYLEKQKEQKPISFNEPYNPDDYEVVMEGNATGLKKKEQKPAEWSEDTIRKAIEEVGLTQHQINWFKNNVFPPKQEWSEEDEMNLYNIIEAIKYTYDVSEGSSGSRLIPWLKSHLHPQPHWKPSKDQMKALEDAFRKDGGNEYRKIINSLYNDLQKLL